MSNIFKRTRNRIAIGKDFCPEMVAELLAEAYKLRAELDEARNATMRAVNVLCETRKHEGKRPCNFCQLLIPEQWRPALLKAHPTDKETK